MKYRLLISLLLVCSICFGQFPRQSFNVGYYANGYTNSQLYALGSASGAGANRSLVDLYSWRIYGANTDSAAAAYAYNTLGQRGNVMILGINNGNPTYTGQSDSITAGGNRSWIPTGIYLNPFNPDSSINTANVWAQYVAAIVTSNGAYFKYWQIWNEPDLTGNPGSYEDSSENPTHSWQKVAPTPDDLQNFYAPYQDYVQLCKVAKQVINHLHPSGGTTIISGGLGYAWYYMWAARAGLNNWIDQIDYHSYPMYDWTYCVWNGTTCGTVNGDNGAHRNSDVAAVSFDSSAKAFRAIETQLGLTHLPMSSTETGLPRWEFQPSNAAFPNSQLFGSSAVQRNFIMKSFQLAMRDTLVFYTEYELGESADSPNISSNNPFVAFGLYQNLTKAGAPGHEIKTPEGIAYTTTANLLKNYTPNYTIPTLTAGTNGTEWDSAGNRMFVVWAVVTHDTVETASGTFNLPAGQTYTEFDWQQNNLGTVSGTVTLNGIPVFLRQVAGATNNPPTVSAGSNQNITATSGTLTGTASAGTGSLTSTVWTEVSGPNTATFGSSTSLTTTITGLVTGTYVFKLTATNSVPLSASSNSTVTVAIAPIAPTAIASVSTSPIVYPSVDSTQLIGTGSYDSNPGGFIAQYQWTLVSGRGGYIIRQQSSGNTYVIFDSVGTYTFQLKVFNNAGISASTTVNVIVNQTLTNPTAVIMASGIITLPVTTVVLNGTGSIEPNQNSSITGFQWQLIKVPSGSSATISSSTSSIAQLINAIPGTYIVALTVRDTNGLTNTVQSTITVNSNQIITNKIVKKVN